MGRRQVNLDDEATIKAFLARLDMPKKSSQTSSTLAIPSSPHKDLPVSDENVIPSTPVQIEHSFSKPLSSSTSTRPLSSHPSPPKTGAKESDSGECVYPPRHYDSEELRAYAPLLTQSTSGNMAEKTIRAYIDESKAGQLADRDGASLHRNRLPLAQIKQIAQAFEQFGPLLLKDQKTVGFSDNEPAALTATNAAKPETVASSEAATNSKSPAKLESAMRLETTAKEKATTPAALSDRSNGHVNDTHNRMDDTHNRMDWTPSKPEITKDVVLPYLQKHSDAPTRHEHTKFMAMQSSEHAIHLTDEDRSDEDVYKLSRNQIRRNNQQNIDRQIALNRAKKENASLAAVGRDSVGQTKVNSPARLKTTWPLKEEKPRPEAVNVQDSLQATPGGSNAIQSTPVANLREQFSELANKNGISTSPSQNRSKVPTEATVSTATTPNTRINVPGANEKDTSSGPQVDMEEQLYFKAWVKPGKRTTAPAEIRRVRLTNLSTTTTASEVASLIFGGPVEQILFTPGNSWAAITFVHSSHCKEYHAKTANGIVSPTDNKHIIWVELGEEVDPMSGLTRSQVDGGCTRSIRAIGIDEDWSTAALTILASGKGRTARKLENMSVKTNRTTGVRTAEFHFCSINDAVIFTSFLKKDEEFDACNINFICDPCEFRLTLAGL